MKRYHSEPNIREMESVKVTPFLSKLSDPEWKERQRNKLIEDDADYEIKNALDEIDKQPPGKAVSEDNQFKRKINNALRITDTKRKRPAMGGRKSRRSRKSRKIKRRRTRHTVTRKRGGKKKSTRYSRHSKQNRG